MHINLSPAARAKGRSKAAWHRHEFLMVALTLLQLVFVPVWLIMPGGVAGLHWVIAGLLTISGVLIGWSTYQQHLVIRELPELGAQPLALQIEPVLSVRPGSVSFGRQVGRAPETWDLARTSAELVSAPGRPSALRLRHPDFKPRLLADTALDRPVTQVQGLLQAGGAAASSVTLTPRGGR